MSLINDALKRARHDHTPRGPQGPLPPLPPVEDSTPVSMWLVPAIVIFLIVAAIFFIGLAVAHHSVHTIVNAPPDPVIATQQAAEVALPIVPAPVAPPPLNPPDAPKLQGIFYSPTAPSAIVDGKTVEVGDHYQQYRVTEITKFTVTLTDSEGKAIKLSMGN
jgi:hypothetical protein